MLQNAYFLAKIGADTAENEQHVAEILPKTGNYLHRRARPPGQARRGGAAETDSLTRTAGPTVEVVASFWHNFGKMLLVFGCIGTDFCKKRCVLQNLSKSTRLSSWHFWNLANFCKFCDSCNFFCWNFTKIADFSNRFFAKILRLQRCKSMQIL